MSGQNVSLAIALEDGRELVAVPGPEDQERLAQLGFSDIVSLAAVDTDTSGHLMSSDVMVDVEGHAMTLRLPTNADAEALKRALAVGAVTATLVAAGTLAALQGGPAAPAVPQTVTRPNAGPPAAEFQLRREQQVDKMLAAPAPIVAPTDIRPSGSIGSQPRRALAAAPPPSNRPKVRRLRRASRSARTATRTRCWTHRNRSHSLRTSQRTDLPLATRR